MKTLTKTLAAAALIAAFASSAVATAGEPEADRVNINTATEAELAYLPGVGPSTAQKIVAHRERRPFKKIEQIIRVRGIGRKTFKKMRPFLAVDGPTTAEKKLKADK